ncbi:MAG: ATPase [Hyphomonadaceae bacterium]|nr:ATPase [Hyphomonadaceae bacterium]
MDKTNRPKRFYKQAGIAQTETGFAVELDGRSIKTPAKAALTLPTEALAKAIAAEWDAQGETLDLPAMTLTRLANVALDRTPETRADLADELARYAGTDVTCYLAEAPTELRERQEAAWKPWRDWAGQELDVVLVPVIGLMASPQPQASLEAVRTHALGLDDFRLTALTWACSLLGSAVLALAVERGQLSATEALTASVVDEDWQIEQWGEDEEARQVRAARADDARALQLWFESLA